MLDIGTCIISYIVFSDLIRLTYFSSHYLVPDMISWYWHLILPWYVCDIYTPGLDMRFLNLTLWPCDTVSMWFCLHDTLLVQDIIWSLYSCYGSHAKLYCINLSFRSFLSLWLLPVFVIVSHIYLIFSGIITVLSFPLSLVYTCWSDSNGSILFFSI